MPAKWYRVDVEGDPARLTILALDSNLRKLRKGEEFDAQIDQPADALHSPRAARKGQDGQS